MFMDSLRKINATLSPGERAEALNILFLMIIGMFLEMFGVGLVVPLMTLLAQDGGARGLPVLSVVQNYLGNIDYSSLVIGAMVVLALVYFVKNLFLSFLLRMQSKFAYGIQASLSQRLFFTYLHQPYSFHLQQNSAQLIRNVATETNLFASHALMQGMQFLTELLVVFGLVFLLIFIEPLGTMVAGLVLATVSVFFFRLTRTRVLKWGVQRQYHEGYRLQHLQQGLGGIKDVILSGRQSTFIAQYEMHNTAASAAAMHQEFLKQIPRLGLEWLAVFGLAAFIIGMVVQGRTLVDVAPVIGAFAAASFRLMPSINRILGSIQTLRYMRPVIDMLYVQCGLSPVVVLNNDSSLLRFEKEIRIESLDFSYASSNCTALKNISFVIKKGQTVGFVGVSGAGKSTLIDIVLGLLNPDKGRVMVDGHDIQNNLQAWHKRIGYVPQTIFLTDDTLRRNIAIGIPDDQIDEFALTKAIKEAQLEDFVAGLPQGLETFVGERGVRLSGGQRQRVGIARALYQDPDVLVLDEATSALDSATENEVMKPIIAMRGTKTVLVVAHRLSTVEHCDIIYRLEAGGIVDEGGPSDVLRAKSSISHSEQPICERVINER